jgi:uridine kinase
MAEWTRQKRDLLDAVAAEFLHTHGKGRTLLAVEAIAGAGQSDFADALADRLGTTGHAVFRASIDEFQHPRAQREARGRPDSAEGYYLDTFDYLLFRRVLTQPFRLGGSAGFVTRAFDVERDAQVQMDWKTGPQDATLVVDGVFLNRPELSELWDFAVWVEAPQREDTDPRSQGAHTLYLATGDPRAKASVIVNNSDAEHPVLAK